MLRVAAEVSFTLIANNSTPIPNAANDFFTFAANPAISAGRVVFSGEGLSGEEGIYIWENGNLGVVVDNSDVMPDGSGNFLGFSEYQVFGNKVLFTGRGGAMQSGIYLAELGGSISTIVDLSMPVPGSTGSFTAFGQIDIAEEHVVFRALDDSSLRGAEGIYRSVNGSAPTLVANQSTPAPEGSGNFVVLSAGMGRWVTAEGTAVISGTSAAQAGFYRATGANLSVIANFATPVTGGGGTLVDYRPFQEPAISGERIAFVAGGNLFITEDGSATKVVGAGDPIPGGSETYYNIEVVSPSEDRVAFTATDSTGQTGLYAWQNGEVVTVLGRGESLDGKPVMRLTMGPSALAGGQLVFRASTGSFFDLTSGIYLASLGAAPATTPPLRITKIVRFADGRLQIEWSPVPDAGVAIDTSGDLVHWNLLADQLTGKNTATLSIPGDPVHAFVRVRQLPEQQP